MRLVVTPGDELIELRLPPRAELVATVRTVASGIAERAGFDPDTVSDVRMAVDEACNQVARRADPRHRMQVGFHLDGGYLRVTITARTDVDDPGIDTRGFGWRVLDTLADELETEHAGGPDGDVLVVRFAKKDPGA